jgi:hypothetical protein
MPVLRVEFVYSFVIGIMYICMVILKEIVLSTAGIIEIAAFYPATNPLK